MNGCSCGTAGIVFPAVAKGQQSFQSRTWRTLGPSLDSAKAPKMKGEEKNVKCQTIRMYKFLWHDRWPLSSFSEWQRQRAVGSTQVHKAVKEVPCRD
jgi:hypothetical protein